MEGEVWLDGHMRLWRVARVGRRWLWGHRRRVLARHESTLDLLAAGITENEMGGDFAREAEEALEAGVRARRARRSTSVAVALSTLCVPHYRTIQYISSSTVQHTP